MSKYTYLKELVYEANMEIPKEELAIVTFGNVSGSTGLPAWWRSSRAACPISACK
jgi:hypothetical protein